MIKKTLPPQRLGSFWGYRMFGGSLLSLIAGFLIIRPILASSMAFVQSYVLLSLLGLVILGAVLLDSLRKQAWRGLAIEA